MSNNNDFDEKLLLQEKIRENSLILLNEISEAIKNSSGDSAVLDKLDKIKLNLHSLGGGSSMFEQQKKEKQFLQNLVRQANQKLEKIIEEVSLIRIINDISNKVIIIPNPLKFIIQNALSVVNADNGSIMNLDKDNSVLKLVAASGTLDNSPSPVHFQLGQGVAGWVAKQGQPLFIEDVLEDTRFFDLGKEERIRAIMCVPILKQGEVIGVFNFSHKVAYSFDRGSLRFVELMAGQTSSLLSQEM